jgi:hypothetical protein
MKHIGKLAIPLAFLAAASLGSQAHAQAIGGNTSIAATTTSANVALPSSTSKWPSVLIAPATGTSVEVFYAIGGSSVAAISTSGSTQSPSLPSGGICVNVGPNTYVAAITASSTANIRITQLSTCAIFSGGSGGSGGGGGGSVTQGTVPWVDSVHYWGSSDTALGAPSAYGTSPGAVNVPGVNAFVTNSVAVTGTSSNASSGVATGSVSISGVSYNYAFNGTTWDQLQDDASKNLKVGPQYSGDSIVNPSANFTRPANTTAYASGQLVANSTTAGSVTDLSWTAARVAAGNFRISRVHMTLSSKSVTNTNFRVHFFNASTGVSNGDGGTFVPSLAADEVCEMDVTIALAGADVSTGYGAANQGVACDVALGSGSTLYALIEARAAYTPASGETITVVPEIHQN